MTAKEFYEANATTTVNVPRVGHPEDKSGWDGVRRASQAQYIASDVEVMPLWDVFDFAEKFRQAGSPQPLPAPPKKVCPHGDPACPCPDGDMCHYEGPNPWKSPLPAPEETTPMEHTCQTPNYTDGPCEACAQEMAAEYALLPCPFCGSMELELDNLGEGDDWFVHCKRCEVQQIANYHKDDAVKRWNTRASSPSVEPAPKSVPHVSMQQLLDTGLNGFGLQLFIESFEKLKPTAQQLPFAFEFRGLRVTFEIPEGGQLDTRHH